MSECYLMGFDKDGNFVRTPFTPRPIPSESEQRKIIEEQKKQGRLVFWHESGAVIVSEREYAAEMVPLFENGMVVRYRRVNACCSDDHR